mgnify:CR=1 FL=1
MTNEEKRFKIVKVKKYEDELSKENRKAIINTFLMATSSLTAASFLFVLINLGLWDLANINIDTTLPKILSGILVPAEMGLAISELKDMVEAISRKTVLKAKIDEINDDLEFAEEEEKRGIRKWW